MCAQGFVINYTPWKIGVSPKNWWLEHEISFSNGPFSGDMFGFGSVSFFKDKYLFVLKSLQPGGFVLPDYSETYTFYVNADDSARLRQCERTFHQQSW